MFMGHKLWQLVVVRFYQSTEDAKYCLISTLNGGLLPERIMVSTVLYSLYALLYV